MTATLNTNLELPLCIKVFFLCKNDFFFHCIESLLKEEGIVIVGTCKNQQLALEQYISSKADIIVMDGNWPSHGHNGVAVLTDFLDFNKELKVIVVTGFFEPTLAARMKESGAKGYFYRSNLQFEVIVACIKQVYLGNECFISNADCL